MNREERKYRNKFIAKAGRKGVSPETLAHRFNVSLSLIYVILRVAGAAPRRKPERVAAARQKAISCFIDQDGTVAEAVKRFKVSRFTVYVACEAHGVPVGQARRSAQVAAFVSQGGSVVDAAVRFKLSQAGVRGICKARKVELPLLPASPEPPTKRNPNWFNTLLMLVNGMSQTAVAERLGVKSPVICDFARRAELAGWRLPSCHPPKWCWEI